MVIRTSAAIDVGSFELEMGIYEISYKTGIRRVDHIRHVIVSGKDMYSEGKVNYGLVEEMCQVLGEFVQIMKIYRVRDYRAYTTSIMGGVRNNQIILGQIRVRTGLDVCIISNSEQRFINYKAIAVMTGEFNKMVQEGTAVVDIGFDSAQLSLPDKDALVATQDLPLGILCVRSPLAKIPATVSEYQGQTEEIMDNELFTLCKMYLKDREINNLIGVGENILYIINRMNLKAYRDKIDAAVMNRFYNRLRQLAMDRIEEKFGVNSEHAPLLLPSVVVYKRILELAGAETFWVPGVRLCDGITAERAQDNKLVKFSHDFRNDTPAASRNMAKRYKCHTSHSQVLEQYALGISNSMRKYHGLGSCERLFLQIVVLLHACGRFINIKSSNGYFYNTIMSTEIIGLNHLEREIIASVVHYNIRNFDCDKVQLKTQLPQENVLGYSRSSTIILATKPTAILRLANSMDRGHRAKLTDCHMAARDNGLVITTGYIGGMVLKASSFDQKANFSEEIFGVKPILKQKRRM